MIPIAYVTNEVEVFAILVNGNLQTVRSEEEQAFEVRDNFNEMFAQRGATCMAQVVKGMLTYNPKDVLSENG